MGSAFIEVAGSGFRLILVLERLVPSGGQRRFAGGGGGQASTQPSVERGSLFELPFPRFLPIFHGEFFLVFIESLGSYIFLTNKMNELLCLDCLNIPRLITGCLLPQTCDLYYVNFIRLCIICITLLSKIKIFCNLKQ